MATIDEEPKNISLSVKKDGPICLTAYFYKTPYNTIRRAKILLFDSILSKYEAYNSLSKTTSYKLSLCKKIERECYNSTIDKAYEDNIITSWDIEAFCNLYHAACYKITSNLELGGIVSNPNFANKLLNGDIDICNLSKLSSQQLYPEKYDKIMKRVEMCKNVSQTIKTSMMYKCEKCGESKCTLENIMTRSADEGISIKLDCINCGNSWMDTSK